MRFLSAILSLIILLSLVSCAAKPVFYKNGKYRITSDQLREKDIEQCQAEADENLTSSKGKRVAKSAGKGAVIGAIGGAAIGLITGNTGKALALGTAVGAGAGAATGGASAAMSPDRIKQNYVTQCLSNKGYSVVGWE